VTTRDSLHDGPSLGDVDRTPVDPPRVGDRSGARLRRILQTLDGSALFAAWFLAGLVMADWAAPGRALAGALLVAGLCTLFGLTLAGSLQLFRSKVLAAPNRALTRWLLVVASSGALFSVAARSFGDPGGALVPVASIAALMAVLAAGSGFEAWLWVVRATGGCVRRVLVVGTPDEAGQVVQLLLNHPEIGYQPVGVVTPVRSLGTATLGVPFLGTTDDVAALARRHQASGAVVAANLLSSRELNQVARDLHQADLHVHVSSGLTGVAPHRLRSLPMAHEPYFYLEPVSPRRVAAGIKRTVDLMLAVVLLVLSAPVLAVAAVAVRLEDGGPVLYRQMRIGRDGQPIVVRKLRTMVDDADRRLEEVRHLNERSGPLFKAARDPRITRVGYFLRATSIDELPQLWSVVTGDLSLVGPRPALPEEVAQFDDDLIGRHRVLPGVTGLWQVEARHNPSFYAYRHLDLFYVENWSVGLDLVILARTARVLVVDLVRHLLPSKPEPGPTPQGVLEAGG
jgi:exopolysaccharide biosynthesis polyprenyl glycosylphosphotransferase